MAKTFHENYESVREELNKTASPLHMRQLKSMKFHYNFICAMSDDYDSDFREILDELNEAQELIKDIRKVVKDYQKEVANQQFEKTGITVRECMRKIIELLESEIESNES